MSILTDLSRRKTIKNTAMGMMALPLVNSLDFLSPSIAQEKLKISLAQWSLHKSFFGKSFDLGWEKFNELRKKDPNAVLQGTIHPSNFPSIARNQFGIEAVEYVNSFYPGRAHDEKYLKALNDQCKQEGVKSLLIMIDGEGSLGSTNIEERKTAVKNHHKWVDAAAFLGCHSIRVNAAGQGSADEVKQAAIEGLGSLTEYGAKNKINIIVENHGSYSSNGEWLSSVIAGVNNSYCGTLPDFGNFCMKWGGPTGCEEEFDRYRGTELLMPFAKGVSAKSNVFGSDGEERKMDYKRLIDIVKKAGYKGYVGIEFEGNEVSEEEGIKLTKALLEKYL